MKIKNKENALIISYKIKIYFNILNYCFYYFFFFLNLYILKDNKTKNNVI